jgi:hypothetical protein
MGHIKVPMKGDHATVGRPARWFVSDVIESDLLNPGSIGVHDEDLESLPSGLLA